jgi:predicted KAP-like P-loop ATPase
MFISDNETAVDLLYYESIAKTIVGLINESADQPMSIGIHGDWGAGKSSILLMTEKAFIGESEVLCLRFNGWQFQGFEDAKAALLEKIVIELRDARPRIEKVKEKAKDLLKRIDCLKLGKKALPWGFTAITGIPHPGVITDAIAALKSVTAGDTAKVVEGLEGVLKPGTERKIPEELRAFEREFKELIEAAELRKLIVLIDDLDRCLPETSIETLEAIRLFLFAPKAVFVIAADEGMIQYAVRKHFPDLPQASGPVGYAQNYLEKLIQVPFRIPALGPIETQVYSALVMAEAAFGDDHEVFKRLLEKARGVLTKPWAGEILDADSINELLKDEVASSIKDAILHSSQIYRVLAEGTKGNPRQIKRFLNAMLLRKKIADARGFGNQIKLPHLAKIMLAEQFHPTFFDQLAPIVQRASEGRPEELALLEEEVRRRRRASVRSTFMEGAGDLSVRSSWDPDDWARGWAKLDPTLASEDLRPYLFITRDKKAFIAGVDAVGNLQELIEALMGDEMAVALRENDVQKLSEPEAQKVVQLIEAKVIESGELKKQPKGIVGLRQLVRHQPVTRRRVLHLLEAFDADKLGGWASNLLDELTKYGELTSECGQLRDRWREHGTKQLKAMITAQEKTAQKSVLKSDGNLR